MTIFQLSMGLRLRYLFYSVLTFILYSFVIDTYRVSTTFAIDFNYLTLSMVASGIVFLYLQIAGIKEAIDFYNQNIVGKRRAARELFRHRDVITIDTTWQSQWQATKKYCCFFNVIPANLFGLGAILAILTFTSLSPNYFMFAVVIVVALLGGLSRSYADHHLCSPEITELYERPHTFKSSLSEAKQEIVERASMEQTKNLMNKERKRNQPPPTQSDDQKRLPRKPY